MRMTHPAARAAGMLQRPHQMLPVQWAPRPYSSACLEEGLHVARWWSQAPQSLPAIPAPVPASHSTFAARRAACHGAPSWTERRSVPFRAQDTHPSHPRLVVCRGLQMFKRSQVKSSQVVYLDLTAAAVQHNAHLTAAAVQHNAHNLRTPKHGSRYRYDLTAAAVQHNARTHSGPQAQEPLSPWTEDWPCHDPYIHRPLIGKMWEKRRRRPSFCARPVHLFPRQ